MGELIKNNGWRVRVAALSIFVLGFIAGALVLNIYHARYSTSVLRSGGPGPSRFGNLAERLNLTPEQESEVERILASAREQLSEVRRESEPRFREIRRLTDEQLQQVLRPEQWEQFIQIRSESRDRRAPGARRGRRSGHGP